MKKHKKGCASIECTHLLMSDESGCPYEHLCTCPKKEKPLRVFQVQDTEENYVYFFVARSHGEARYAFCNEVGISFDETFGYCSINVVPRLEKYIDGSKTFSGYMIELFSDEHWIRALYAEGGSFTNGNCELPTDKILTIEEMIARECRHEGKTEYECWDDERIWITLPPKKKSV